MQIRRALTKLGHSRAIEVTSHPLGWCVCRKEDGSIVRCVVYDDWHRVERALRVFQHVAWLQGWAKEAA
jgi:hypothetical protein